VTLQSFSSKALAGLILIMSTLAVPPEPATANPSVDVETFKLDNGMDVVVIPNHRAPVVTHMVYYKVGAADEPPGVSGIAHFLEHLMFKSTDKIASGEFSKIVSRLGGQDNAFTGNDVTAYFQKIAKEQLATVMSMEADRMVNLRLSEKEVLTERNVILEERRSRIENSPSAILSEQMDATLFYSHPYGIPVIGWEHEMAKLSREDALKFYKRFYAPNNAILIVAGDVEPQGVLKLAKQTYGKIPANKDVGGERQRPKDPPQRSARRVDIKDPRAGKPTLYRDYLVPSTQTAKPGEAEALTLLATILADGPTSRLYKKLVVEDKLASSADGGYWRAAIDDAKLAIYAVAADGVDLKTVETAMDKVIADIRENGVTQRELDRARAGEIAQYVYDSDSQSTLARRYGYELAIGRTLEDINAWPKSIENVTVEQVQDVAKKYLDLRRSVTGTLAPEAPVKGAAGSTPGNAPKASSQPSKS
jgi:zinc protease